MNIAPDWNEKQARLREIIKQEAEFDEARHLFLAMHRSLHFSDSASADPTYMDLVWDGLEPSDLTIMPTVKDVTIAWNVWHITRIEDLTVNILINRSGQLLDESWLSRLNTNVTDTGNAMTDEEILRLSADLDMNGLKQYRIAVGKRTQEILQTLTFSDMRRKFGPDSLEKIRREGGVTEHPDSSWLVDFWGRKDVAGILLMPVTRHQIGHLNDCESLKRKIRRLKS